MKLNLEVANEAKQRMLSLCTHDCMAFIRFREVIEEGDYEETLKEELDAFFLKLNNILKYCGAQP